MVSKEVSLIERILNRLFNKKEIVNCDRDTYLHRWYLTPRSSTLFGIFIHKFIRSDEDRAVHDHPWNFIVIPIWRGYYEWREESCRRCDGLGVILRRFGSCICPDCNSAMKVIRPKRVLPILGTRFRRGTYKHRVELLSGMVEIEPFELFNNSGIVVAIEQELPSWSIFIRFKKFRDWGFHTPEGWIQWNKWWQEKCE